MFYSHEILTSRKYGVATVWLVATLGSKSTTRKISRKAILDVDVKKACNTIIEPEAPMALRLQSSLLYGVSKVYGQQVAYVLMDATHVEQGLRGLGKKFNIKNVNLDRSVQARPEQLLLLDDPAFDPDMALPALVDFDFDNLNLDESQKRDSQTSLSIHSQRARGSSISSSQGPSIMGINISSSIGTGGGYQLPLDDPFAISSAHKAGLGLGGDPFDDEAILFEDDNMFEFDDDGNVRDLTVQDIAARRTANAVTRLGSDSAASARVRKEHEDARLGQENVFDADGDFGMIYGEDDQLALPGAEPFDLPIPVFMSGALPVPASGTARSSQLEESLSESSDSPIIKARVRKARTKKHLPIDLTQQLRNSDLGAWHRDYIDTQKALSKTKLLHTGNSFAKKNAEMFVYGNGINGVGIGISSGKFESPLSMFSSHALLAHFSREAAPLTRKRPAEEALEDDHVSAKRLRRSSDGELPRKNDDDGFEMQLDADAQFEFGTPGDVEVEMGRDAQDALLDYPSSALMPWNVSASQRGRSSSLRPSAAPGRGISASPLIGRGSMLPGGELEKFSSQQDLNEIMYGREDDFSGDGFGDGGYAAGVMSDEASREFEMFGPAANVDTQTAAQSQWVRSALDSESKNFLDFVKERIGDKFGEEDDEDELGRDDERERKVGFEELFTVGDNSAVVAAQAFLHILALATRGRIWAEQDEGEGLEIGGSGLGGEIWMGVL